MADYVKNKAAREVAASQEARAFKDPQGCPVSVDGSWMKRGFTSLYGIVVVIGQLTGFWKVRTAKCVRFGEKTTMTHRGTMTI